MLISNVKGSIVINIIEQNGNVVTTMANGSSIDTTIINLLTDAAVSSAIEPASALIALGEDDQANLYFLRNLTGPGSFGDGPAVLPSSEDGIHFGFNGTLNVLAVPDDYSSGSSLDGGTATYLGQTLITLGITVGTHEWSWGDGGTETLTLNVVPEPSTYAVLFSSIIVLFMTTRRFRSKRN